MHKCSPKPLQASAVGVSISQTASSSPTSGLSPDISIPSYDNNCLTFSGDVIWRSVRDTVFKMKASRYEQTPLITQNPVNALVGARGFGGGLSGVSTTRKSQGTDTQITSLPHNYPMAFHEAVLGSIP